MKPELEKYTLQELTSLKKDVEAAINSFNARALAHARQELEKKQNQWVTNLMKSSKCASHVLKLLQNIVIQTNLSKLGQVGAVHPSGLNSHLRTEKH